LAAEPDEKAGGDSYDAAKVQAALERMKARAATRPAAPARGPTTKPADPLLVPVIMPTIEELYRSKGVTGESENAQAWSQHVIDASLHINSSIDDVHRAISLPVIGFWQAASTGKGFIDKDAKANSTAQYRQRVVNGRALLGKLLAQDPDRYTYDEFMRSAFPGQIADNDGAARGTPIPVDKKPKPPRKRKRGMPNY
jgi:hypothetical protein